MFFQPSCFFISFLLYYLIIFVNSKYVIDTNITHIKRQISDSIGKNLVGTDCEYEYVDHFEDFIKYSGNKLAVNYYLPKYNEMNDYLSMESITMTRSNPSLGKGYVQGSPSAEIWAEENKQSWAIPPDHPRNAMKQYCVESTKQSGAKPVILYKDMMKSLVPFYIVKARNVFLDDNGIAALDCGYLQGHEACETLFKFIGKRWRKKCIKNSITTIPVCIPSEGNVSMIRDIDTIFVITAQWDHNYHHYLIDSFMRLVRYIDYIRNNPKIMIHIRGYEKFADSDVLFRRKEEREAKKDSFMKAARDLRKKINEFMGIDDNRFVSGPVRAKVAYFPRPIHCNSPISHALEVRLLSSLILQRSFETMIYNQPITKTTTPTSASSRTIHSKKDFFLERLGFSNMEHLYHNDVSKKKKLIIQYRHCSEMDCKKTWRGWTEEQFQDIYKSFRNTYVDHEIVVMSSLNKNMSNCLPCQIREYADADIILGLHGAGMTNVIFMKPDSLVIEIIGKFDGRMLPICGYHGPLIAMYGVHHYLYYYDWKGEEILYPEDIAKNSYEFYHHIQSIKLTRENNQNHNQDRDFHFLAMNKFA